LEADWYLAGGVARGRQTKRGNSMNDEDFSRQAEWFGHLSAPDLACRALRDCREIIRTSNALIRVHEMAVLVLKLARYAESRLVSDLGARTAGEQLRDRVASGELPEAPE
jgi:hypothetical protein